MLGKKDVTVKCQRCLLRRRLGTFWPATHVGKGLALIENLPSKGSSALQCARTTYFLFSSIHLLHPTD